jgi:hypothetical protein
MEDRYEQKKNTQGRDFLHVAHTPILFVYRALWSAGGSICAAFGVSGSSNHDACTGEARVLARDIVLLSRKGLEKDIRMLDVVLDAMRKCGLESLCASPQRTLVRPHMRWKDNSRVYEKSTSRDVR